MKIETIFVKYIKLREKLDNAKIYKIVDNINDNVYIGSTCYSLKTRLSVHKSAYKRFLNGLGGNTKSFDVLKNNDYKIELIENCNIKTKQELLARERFYIENNNCLNKNIPGNLDDKGTQQYQKDYYNDNKNKIDDYQKEYREANKDKKKEKLNCVCGGNYTHCNKSHHIKTTKHLNFFKNFKINK